MSRRDISRRAALSGGLAALALPASWIEAAAGDLAAEMSRALGGRKPEAGRVSVSLPELAENGHSVPITVTVESPMSDADHVRAIHVFSEKNPVNHVCRVALSPRSGRARISTNIRLADGQWVIAVAETSDGRLWMGGADIVVTQPACIDDSVQ